MKHMRATSTKPTVGFGHANLFFIHAAGLIFPTRIGPSETRSCYLPVGETCDSSFSTLTPGKDPYSNMAIHRRATEGAAAKLGG